MDYQHDVFLSYRRHKEWPKWIEKTFFNILDHWLSTELGRDCDIFVDYQIETGHDWPTQLANALSRSRVLIPLFSPQYFNSNWCIKEITLFYAREKSSGFGTKENSQRLIIPAVIHGNMSKFPKKTRIIQCKEIQPFCNIRTAKSSRTIERLSEEIRNWTPDICNAINVSPDFDPNWKQLAYESLMDIFRNPPDEPKSLIL